MNKPRRAPRRQVDGVLLLDKSSGMTSNTALQIARRLFTAAKGGHTGTLDPLATGLLPLCFGEATKFAGELLSADKTYRATLRLGITTDSADADGNILLTRAVSVSASEFEQAAKSFVGEIEQIPPMYSALKRDGKPLYEYARAGIELERAARPITIHSLQIRHMAGDTAEIDVSCSKGTYIRTLVADIGEHLGCGAHLTALRRLRIGDLDVAGALSLETLESIAPELRDDALLPADALLEGLPRADLSASDVARIQHGQAIRWSQTGARWRLYGEDDFLGLGYLTEDGWLQPKRLLVSAGVPKSASSC